MSVRVLRRRFTVEEYHRMAEAGILSEDDRVELIDGELVEMTAIGSRHAECVNRLTRLLVPLISDRAVVSVQNPVRLGRHSEPQPDLMLLRPRSYAAALPGPEDVLLLIEVADTSVEYDRGIKFALYAGAGIPEAWLVDLEAGVIEVCSDPTPNGYSRIRMARHGEHVAPDAFPDARVGADEILI